MKSKIYGYLTLLFCCLLFEVSCKKTDVEVKSTEANNTDPALITKVKEWLQEQKSSYQEVSKKTKIQNLEDNLVFNKLNTQYYINGEKFIVVPIGNGFISVNNADKTQSSYLLLILTSNGDIRRGNIVQYQPKQRSIPLPANAFNKIFAHEVIPSFNSVFAFLTIADELSYEVNIVNGIGHSVSEIDQKASTRNVGKTSVEACWDVYWVTFYQDGSSTWDF